MERQTEATDREIDRLVYELYGLTGKEIAIVEQGDERGTAMNGTRASPDASDESGEVSEQEGAPPLTWPALIREMFYRHRLELLLVTAAILGAYLAARARDRSCGLFGCGLTGLATIGLGLTLFERWFRRRLDRKDADKELRASFGYTCIEPATWALAMQLRSATGNIRKIGDLWDQQGKRRRYRYIGDFVEDAKARVTGRGLLQLEARHPATGEITEEMRYMFDFGAHTVNIEVGQNMRGLDRPELLQRITERFSRLEGVTRL